MRSALLPQHEAHQPHADRPRRTAARLSVALSVVLAAASGELSANADPLIGLLPPGGSGVGFTVRSEASLYRGDERKYDLVPHFAYDGRYFYLQSDRAGLKLEREKWRAELFVKRRLEGFPSDEMPASMTGLEKRSVGSDTGVAASLRLGEGTAYVELSHDGGGTSNGTELRLGYRYESWWSGRTRWRPYFTASYRDAKLNNYYYGVPGYEPGSGINLELGAVAAHRLSEHWQLFGRIALLRASEGVRGSPVVEDKTTPSATVGLMYGFTPRAGAPLEGEPLIVRVLHGASTECHFLKIMALVCIDTHTHDPTNVSAIEFGRRLVERLNGWPVDIAGFVGLLHHDEQGLQKSFWQVNGYLKAYFYGFPWRERLRTRLGFGGGISYASRIPFSEAREQARRGRDTSKLLLYADPSIDINLGDLLGARELREVYAGFGVSHRSGIFGSAQLFNNVNGGSNYIYGYVEASF
jgi:outer membrane protein